MQANSDDSYKVIRLALHQFLLPFASIRSRCSPVFFAIQSRTIVALDRNSQKKRKYREKKKIIN